ncbi:pseudouridine synthase [Polychytrium aggregatum]|uniref:pseudouridine synthase n=1 Tax=Polychytrium aggregatum TaxID=110093 RepID=UPI0022FE9F54|nr:pseudouridine synthase [Polychytrium aggregatum]KAI9207576.1 pseudouridine synthase [Polychytrium aggregatum]
MPAVVDASGVAHISLAILYGYLGTEFASLEALSAQRSIEGELLNALATVVSSSGGAQAHQIAFINLSRASKTEQGEHAARQCLSLEVTSQSGSLALPTVSAVNAALPDPIRVYGITEIASVFSARRSCDARTYEYVFPTYILSKPPPASHFDLLEPYPENHEDISAVQTREEGETLFQTLHRGRTIGRSKSLSKQQQQQQQQPPLSALPAAVSAASPSKHEGGGTFSRFFKSLGRAKEAPTSTAIPQTPTDESSHSDAKLFETIKRTLSRKGTNELPPQDNPEPVSAAPVYYDPIAIPKPSADELAALKAYRITGHQIRTLEDIFSIYRGTHNWHNYIPGASADDSRCYMRILQIEASSPEIHHGIEWIRVKFQAKAFASFQIRKMMALAILVIRTNTPRSLIANSFGLATINIPEAPATGLILDNVLYAEYNADQTIQASKHLVSFEDYHTEASQMKHQFIHQAIFTAEEAVMIFEDWIRTIDSYSFLYTHFLNHRGVILPANAFIRVPADTTTEPGKLGEDNRLSLHVQFDKFKL